MAQTYLITKTDILEYRQISKSVRSDVLNMHIIDAQFTDVQKLLGMEFYNDLILNYSDTKYQTLLNGGTYEYNGTTYTNVGLKAVIVHYFYARYVLTGSQIDTAFGRVEKLSNDSEKVDYSGKKTVSKMNQQSAFTYWENVKLFLDRNNSDYELWNNNCIRKNGTFRISKINGNSDYKYKPLANRFSYD